MEHRTGPGSAELLGLEKYLVQNSFLHFSRRCAAHFPPALAAALLAPERPAENGRAWREIDLRALIQRSPAQTAGWTALRAYGRAQGRRLRPRSRSLCAAPLRRTLIAVATLSEGIALRKAFIRGTILILGYTPPSEAGLLVRWRLTQAVVDEPYARQLAAQGRRVRVQLAADTGMHRLGVPASELASFRRIYRLPRLRFTGLFSHLCAANSFEPSDEAFTARQTDTFLRLAEALRACGCPVGETHLLASAGLLCLRPQPCSHARPGLALFGAWKPLGNATKAAVFVPSSPCGHGSPLSGGLKRANAPDTVSHSRLHGPRCLRLLPSAMPTGSRDLPERGGEVLLHGVRVPIVGRLCMDQL